MCALTIIIPEALAHRFVTFQGAPFTSVVGTAKWLLYLGADAL